MVQTGTDHPPPHTHTHTRPAVAVDEPEEGEDDYQETTLFINKMLPNVNVTYTAPGDDGGDVALTTLFVNYTFVPGTAGR